MTNWKTTNGLTDCPPPGATAASGEVYRCCRSSPPSDEDMKTAEECGRLTSADPCLRCALSVLRSETDAVHQARLFRRWRQRFVARATLSPAHGRCLLTPAAQPSHTSWWPNEGLDPAGRAALFNLVREVKP